MQLTLSRTIKFNLISDICRKQKNLKHQNRTHATKTYLFIYFYFLKEHEIYKRNQQLKEIQKMKYTFTITKDQKEYHFISFTPKALSIGTLFFLLLNLSLKTHSRCVFCFKYRESEKRGWWLFLRGKFRIRVFHQKSLNIRIA